MKSNPVAHYNKKINTIDKNIDDVYSHLRINKTLQYSFGIILVATFILLTMFMFRAVALNHDWFAVGVFSTIICSFVICFPLTEEWVYKPWQKTSKKIEYNYDD